MMSKGNNNNEEVRGLCEDGAKRGIHFHAPFAHVPKGYVLVKEGLFTGKIGVANEGITLALPTSERTYISVAKTPIDYKKEKYKSLDGYEIIVDTAITYTITNPRLFYVEKNALQQLNIKMSSILRRLIAQCNYVTVSELKIDLLYETWIKDELTEFEGIYGIKVEDIVIQRAELNDDLRKSQEEDALVKAENKRKIETAEAEKKIAELKADATKLQGIADAEVAAMKVDQIISKIGSVDTPEKLRLLRDIIIGDTARYNIFESNSSNNNDNYQRAIEFATAFDSVSKTSEDEPKKK